VQGAGTHPVEPTGRIFGIGLSRTGTRSLLIALRGLGCDAVHYPFDRITESELFAGDDELTLLRRHDGMLDLPAAAFFARLDRCYPGSRFVLTTREREDWIAAVVKHYEGLLAEWDGQPARFREFSERITTHVYGDFPPTRAGIAAAGERHERAVGEHFTGREDDLLRLDVCAGDGWQELAAFLGAEGGAPATRFPHARDEDETMMPGVERTLFKQEVEA
jgi:Sulfotransferase domain